jgi:AcrR family transcriptional regulator
VTIPDRDTTQDPDEAGDRTRPPAPRPRQRRRDAVKTRETILRAAGTLFARHGYAQVPLKDIADAAGITPALIVHYFGSKRDLFAEVVQDRMIGTVAPQELGKLDITGLAQITISYWQDETLRVAPYALLRSMEFDGGELFRQEMMVRVLEAWREAITGVDAALRMRLIAGITMGFGFFTTGGLLEPDRPPPSAEENERMARYLERIIAVCLEPIDPSSS